MHLISLYISYILVIFSQRVALHVTDYQFWSALGCSQQYSFTQTVHSFDICIATCTSYMYKLHMFIPYMHTLFHTIYIHVLNNSCFTFCRNSCTDVLQYMIGKEFNFTLSLWFILCACRIHKNSQPKYQWVLVASVCNNFSIIITQTNIWI